MDIEFDRRHAFYFDIDGNIRCISPYRLERLWRGEPDAAMPELANQRVRFAVLHIERFTKPPRVALEHYPVLTFDAHGHVDVERQRARLQAEVDHLEASGYEPLTVPTTLGETNWHPDPVTRRRLIAATQSSYARRSPTTPHHGVPTTARGRSPRPAPAPLTRPTARHPRPATLPAFASPRR